MLSVGCFWLKQSCNTWDGQSINGMSFIRIYQADNFKVKVADRTAVVTTNAETTIEKPTGLQEDITALTVKYPQGRCFVRPSGTEDVVRVYAESNIQETADQLASSVSKVVDQFLGFSSS